MEKKKEIADGNAPDARDVYLKLTIYPNKI